MLKQANVYYNYLLHSWQLILLNFTFGILWLENFVEDCSGLILQGFGNLLKSQEVAIFMADFSEMIFITKKSQKQKHNLW